MGICYGILYIFAIFTTNSLLTCLYAFPMYMVIVLYMDVRFCILIGCGAFLGNVACIIKDNENTVKYPTVLDPFKSSNIYATKRIIPIIVCPINAIRLT